MDIKTTTAKLFYRVEAKPEGGFRAVPYDSTMETIEGSSREEVDEKIRAKLGEIIAANFHRDLKIGGTTVAINTKINLTARNQSRSAINGGEINSLQVNGELVPKAAPITPGDGTGTTLRVFAFMIALVTLIYFLFHLFHR